MSEILPTVLCVVCSTQDKPRKATQGYLTCDRCSDRIKDALDEILSTYATLDDVEALIPAVAPGARRGPGFASRSPARDGVIAITDRRSNGSYGDIHCPPVVMESWARMVRDDRSEPQPDHTTLSNEIHYLIKQTDWVTRQDWVGDYWREIREVREQLRHLDGEKRYLPIGTCPGVNGNSCGAVLKAPFDGSPVHCRSCPAKWPYPQWGLLGRLMEDKDNKADGVEVPPKQPPKHASKYWRCGCQEWAIRLVGLTTVEAADLIMAHLRQAHPDVFTRRTT